MTNRLKKPRGKLEKLRRHGLIKWLRYQAKFAKIAVSDITEEGFWLHTLKYDFYFTRKRMLELSNISRSISCYRLDPFTAITDEQIRDVDITVYDDASGDSIFWPKLDVLLSSNHMDGSAEKIIVKPDWPPKFVDADTIDLELKPLESDGRILVWYVNGKRWSEIKGSWKEFSETECKKTWVGIEITRRI